MRFRAEALDFKVTQSSAAEIKDMGLGDADRPKVGMKEYPAATKTLTSEGQTTTFKLHVEAGSFTDAEVIGLMGENGTGKTTYLHMLAGFFDKKISSDAETGEASYDSVPVSLRERGLSIS